LDTDESIVIGMLGCGVVGGGVADRVLSGITFRAGRLRLGGVLVRDLSKPREPSRVRQHLTTDAERVLNDANIDILVECMGGVEPAAKHVESALRRGIHVVTANKALIADRGARLTAIAGEYGVALRYEAAVGGAIPVIRTLEHLAECDEILEVGGVINGTTNFVLSAMEGGRPLEQAVRDAQRAGFAESDPSTDLEGIDAAHKLAILSATAFGAWPRWESIARRGIREITLDDVEYARSRGCRIKSAAWARRIDRIAIVASVGPTLIPIDHPFAAPRDAENVVLAIARHAGPIILGGVGAGREATASAIIGDLADILRELGRKNSGAPDNEETRYA
jgi:homoserine dehydrogenase